MRRITTSGRSPITERCDSRWLLPCCESKLEIETNEKWHRWSAYLPLSFVILAVLVIISLVMSLRNARRLAITDELTGIRNSRYLTETLRKEIEFSKRHSHPISLALLDIDDFKGINDIFGHATGNQVLKDIVRHASNSIRPTDTLARIGGDEFAILMPRTDCFRAVELISKFGTALPIGGLSDKDTVTISVGLVTFNCTPKSVEDVLSLADALMYAAKSNGGNEIESKSYS